MLARGKEAVGLVALGIIGSTLFTLDIYLASEQSTRLELGTVQEFFADPDGLRFLCAVTAASFCNGLFVIPLQAMAQRRANPKRRARLMSAGSVLLNLSVNGMTFILIGLGFMSLPPEFPFLIVIVLSSVVAIYAFSRWRHLRRAEAI